MRAGEHERIGDQHEGTETPQVTVQETQASQRFATTGKIPPVGHGFHDPTPSASDRAFGTPSVPEVEAARRELDKVDHDRKALHDERREVLIGVIRQILEKARESDHVVAEELLELLRPYASVPGVASAISETAAVAAARTKRTAEQKGHQEEQHTAAPAGSSTSTAATTGQPAAWQTEGWAPDSYANASYTGVKPGHKTDVDAQQLMKAFAKVAPHLPHTFLVMLVGHAMAEQRGGGVFNYNFGGIEGHHKAVTQDVWTSAIIPVTTYEANKAKYRDWDWMHHPPNPKAYACHGHYAGTIDYQLHLDPKPTEIGVMEAKDRPAYETLEEGAVAFIHEIERRIKALQASTKPQDNALAQAALDGDAHAYGQIVNNVFYITGADHKAHNFGAFNGDKGKADSKDPELRKSYGDRVEDQIKAAREQFPEQTQ